MLRTSGADLLNAYRVMIAELETWISIMRGSPAAILLGEVASLADHGIEASHIANDMAWFNGKLLGIGTSDGDNLDLSVVVKLNWAMLSLSVAGALPRMAL